MLRAALSAAFAVLLTSCAHERTNNAEDPAVAAVAHFIIEAVSPAAVEDYSWEAFSARIEDTLSWRSPQSSAVLLPEFRREGRLLGSGGGQGVIIVGDRAQVRTLSIDTNSFHALALLAALRRAGADVSFQGDFESYSEYIVTPAGRDVALLTTNSTCIPFDPQPGEVCRNYVTLTFNPH
jgi:hypothetical protein